MADAEAPPAEVPATDAPAAEGEAPAEDAYVYLMKIHIKQNFNHYFLFFFRLAFSAPAIVQISENPTFTLFYFNVKALAEPIRFLFAYGGQEYEDVRVTRDEWPALKPSM